MKEHCLQIAARAGQASEKYNVLREYTQAYVLKLMQEAGQFASYAFVGGTALRFLYDLPRFSEDLDFSCVSPAARPFADVLLRIKNELILAGYQVEVTCRDHRAVHAGFIKFEGLMYEAGLSALPAEKFSIKIEADTRPPEGGVLVTKITNRFFPLAFLSYDLPSLFAGKVHAVLTRPYVKGRDYYDIAWYLSRHKSLAPNFILLSRALVQTQAKHADVNETNWRRVLADHVVAADWRAVEADVLPFLERPDDMKVFTQPAVLGLINGY